MRGSAGRLPTGLQSKPFFLSAFPHPTGGFIILLLGIPLLILESASQGLQCRCKTSSHPGILVLSTRLGQLRHPVSQPEKLPDSHLLQHEVAIIELTDDILRPVSYLHVFFLSVWFLWRTLTNIEGFSLSSLWSPLMPGHEEVAWCR